VWYNELLYLLFNINFMAVPPVSEAVRDVQITVPDVPALLRRLHDHLPGYNQYVEVASFAQTWAEAIVMVAGQNGGNLSAEGYFDAWTAAANGHRWGPGHAGNGRRYVVSETHRFQAAVADGDEGFDEAAKAVLARATFEVAFEGRE